MVKAQLFWVKAQLLLWGKAINIRGAILQKVKKKKSSLKMHNFRDISPKLVLTTFTRFFDVMSHTVR